MSQQREWECWKREEEKELKAIMEEKDQKNTETWRKDLRL